MSLFPTSWSKISSYLTCAKQYAEFRVFKTVVEEKAEATIWGEEVHAVLEATGNARLEIEKAKKEGRPAPPEAEAAKELPERFKQYDPLLEKVAKIPGDHYIELKLAVDADFNPCDYNDEVNGRLRGSIDRLIISPSGKSAFALDYKTGKRKEFSRQLELYALFVFCRFPEVEEVHAIYIWTQGGKPTHKTIKRTDLKRIQKEFNGNLKDMEWSYQHNAWPPSPSGLCGPNRAGTYKGCSVRTCPHNRRRD